MPPAALAHNSVLLFTHRLRCGLEECRQLCWLGFKSVKYLFLPDKEVFAAIK